MAREKVKPASTDVGVIIGRFQVPDLHKAHREDIFDAVFDRHKKVLVLLGVSPVKISNLNPLDYMTREIMVKKAYPKAVVMPLKDMPVDEDWTRAVDDQISGAIGDSSVTIYGSRDSFIPHYSGRYKTVQLPSSYNISGTQSREAASKEVRAERAFRVGVIYASCNRYPISYQCVDAVIWRPIQTNKLKAGPSNSLKWGEDTEILLGHKRTDPVGKLRFIGGFMQPGDSSLEDGAVREAIEETGGNLSLDNAKYIFSSMVDDFRYKREKDKIMTAVVAVQAIFGVARASDDMDELEWYRVSKVKASDMVPEHEQLWPKVKAHFETPKPV